MGKVGAPKGNTNATKNKSWGDALRRHAVQNPDALNRAAAALFKKAGEGDVQAAKEIGDRLDGKAIQTIAGDPHAPIIHEVIYRIASKS